MFGKTVGTLNMYYRSGITETLLYSVSGNRGNKWMENFVKMPTCIDDFQIVLEGVRGHKKSLHFDLV
jgi:hypothetical protein